MGTAPTCPRPSLCLTSLASLVSEAVSDRPGTRTGRCPGQCVPIWGEVSPCEISWVQGALPRSLHGHPMEQAWSVPSRRAPGLPSPHTGPSCLHPPTGVAEGARAELPTPSLSPSWEVPGPPCEAGTWSTWPSGWDRLGSHSLPFWAHPCLP